MPGGVVVAGGGVAALETVAALRALAGPDVGITVVAPAAEVERRGMSVTTPFGGEAAAPVSLPDVAERLPFELRLGECCGVEPGGHLVHLDGGESLAYDRLVMAMGAVARAPFPGAVTFRGLHDAAAVSQLLETAELLAFVCPTASGWSLPVYELALLAARERTSGEVAVVTAEASPLWIFGPEAGEAMRELCRRRGVALLTGVRVLAAADGLLELDGAEPVAADRAIALPRLTGPAIDGLPHDEEGFIPVDAYGRVEGVPGVYAAGDVTAFPLKQGGLAAQQADAVAETIAAALGAPVTPRPFAPVLRGLLITGAEPLYLRSDGASGSSYRLPHSAVSTDALWWPPVKVAGRHLAPLLEGDGEAAELRDLLTSAETQRPEPETAAAEVTLALAREDAQRGDYAEALRGLDTARALSGGRLPEEWERTRVLWQARAEPPAW